MARSRPDLRVVHRIPRSAVGVPTTLRLASRTVCLSTVLVAAMLGACVGPPTAESEREVRELWNQYLASRMGSLVVAAGTPSPFWSPAEQARWSDYDLASQFVPMDAVARVVAVTPVSSAVDTAYRIQTRFWADDSSAGDSLAAPVLTTTVYARREKRRWVLANALPYHTSAWVRETRGRIHFVVAPALRFNPTRAERAAAFVDSLAAAFDVEPPPRIEYYVAESVDQAMEILGAVAPQRYGPNGGFARTGRVFSGNPALGEEYRHELAHVVLAPVFRDGPTSLIASEGVPTWLGGTAGRDFQGSVKHLATFLRTQPALDLQRIVYDMTVSSEIRNAAGAVLSHMLHEAGGIEAVKEFLRTSTAEIPDLFERVLQRPWDTVMVDWRRRVDQLSAT